MSPSDVQLLHLPAPDGHADLGSVEPGETASVWHMRGAVFEDLGTWVRAASASAPLEIAGHDVDPEDLDAMEHDLLALLAAVRASRMAGPLASPPAEPDGDHVPALLDRVADAIKDMRPFLAAKELRTLAKVLRGSTPEVRAAVAAELARPTAGGAR